jgi:hypothetical protein
MTTTPKMAQHLDNTYITVKKTGILSLEETRQFTTKYTIFRKR